MASIVRCERCGRRRRSLGGWNATFDRGRIVGYLCPDCQSPEENAEAAINEATIDYSRWSVDEDGRLHAPAKGDED